MKKNKTIHVKGTELVVLCSTESDFSTLTDWARPKNKMHTDAMIQH